MVRNLDSAQTPGTMYMLSLETYFAIGNFLALTGWFALLIDPLLRRFSVIYAGFVIPLILSLGYTVLLLLFWSGAEGGSASLASVAALFRTPELLLAGWLHYLAFDLLIGAWQVRQWRETGRGFWMLTPCLVLTFLFGPAGLLCFFALRYATRFVAPSTAEY